MTPIPRIEEGIVQLGAWRGGDSDNGDGRGDGYGCALVKQPECYDFGDGIDGDGEGDGELHWGNWGYPAQRLRSLP